MVSLQVVNIGPLKDTGILEFSRINAIMGRQSTGKSTLMKILCFCRWLEKKIMVGDDKSLIYEYTHYSHFLKVLQRFHRISRECFHADSELHYQGECIKIDLIGTKNAKISRLSNFSQCKHNLKLSFIPSERNLVSAMKNVEKTYKSSDYDVLFNHINEWSKAREYVSENNPIDLSAVGNLSYYYDNDTGNDYIVLSNKHKISPFYASSGVQSVVPIEVLARFLFEVSLNNPAEFSIDDLIRILSSGDRIDISKDSLKEKGDLLKYRCAHLFVEEPEQNLFPDSQCELITNMVNRVIRACEIAPSFESTLTFTTHSPYVISAINVMLLKAVAYRKDPQKYMNKFGDSFGLQHEFVRVYHINEKGTVQNLVIDDIPMIDGTYLDKMSEKIEDEMANLNTFIYG